MMYRCGSADGDTGTTFFLLAGVTRRIGYNRQWLERNGASVGSNVFMTENAYMTTQAWEEMTDDLCHGIRRMNRHVEEMKEWWMLEIFDGFGAHLSSLDALWKRREHRVLSLKEEGD